MRVKTKKRFNGRVVKIQGAGDIKEVLINADMIEPDKRIIAICFRGRESSGIVELSEEEAEDLGKTLSAQAKLVRAAKVLKDYKKK